MGAQLNISLQLIAENIYNLLITILFGASKLGILYRQVKVTAVESRWTGRPEQSLDDCRWRPSRHGRAFPFSRGLAPPLPHLKWIHSSVIRHSVSFQN